MAELMTEAQALRFASNLLRTLSAADPADEMGYRSAAHALDEQAEQDEAEDQPDREPSAEQERAWDLREDEARGGHAG